MIQEGCFFLNFPQGLKSTYMLYFSEHIYAIVKVNS